MCGELTFKVYVVKGLDSAAAALERLFTGAKADDLTLLVDPGDLTPVFGPGSRMAQLGCVESFELGGGEHIQGGVPPAVVVEVLDVVGDSYAELFYGAPGAGVEQFGLHSSPE